VRVLEAARGKGGPRGRPTVLRRSTGERSTISTRRFIPEHGRQEKFRKEKACESRDDLEGQERSYTRDELRKGSA